MHLEVKRSFGSRSGRRHTRNALYLAGKDTQGKRHRHYIRTSAPEYSLLFTQMVDRPKLPPGRPPTYPEKIKAIFTECGFNMHGARISMDRKRYFTIASAESRFTMLSDVDKIRIGSAWNMLSIEKQAYGRLKKANVKGISCTYSDCLREVMLGAQPLPPAPHPDVPQVPA